MRPPRITLLTHVPDLTSHQIAQPPPADRARRPPDTFVRLLTSSLLANSPSALFVRPRAMSWLSLEKRENRQSTRLHVPPLSALGWWPLPPKARELPAVRPRAASTIAAHPLATYVETWTRLVNTKALRRLSACAASAELKTFATGARAAHGSCCMPTKLDSACCTRLVKVSCQSRAGNLLSLPRCCCGQARWLAGLGPWRPPVSSKSAALAGYRRTGSARCSATVPGSFVTVHAVRPTSASTSSTVMRWSPRTWKCSSRIRRVRGLHPWRWDTNIHHSPEGALHG